MRRIGAEVSDDAARELADLAFDARSTQKDVLDAILRLCRADSDLHARVVDQLDGRAG